MGVVLSARERWLLVVPLLGGVAFGILPFVLPVDFPRLVGYSGDDPLVSRLAGAAALGYLVALIAGMRDGRWEAIRNVVLATLVFNVVSLIACAIEIASGRPFLIVWLIVVADIAIVLITASLLVRYGASPQGPRDVATYVVVLLILATLASVVFGLAPQVPSLAAPFFGYRGTDEFVYRESGAATLGYAVMGIWQLRSLRWAEMTLPTLMAFVFNALAFIGTLLESSPLTLGVALVAPASLVFAIATFVILIRRGR
jgi:hypothetical protein